MVAAAIASLIPAAVKLGTSVYQMIKARKLGKEVDPGYVIPKEQMQALENAQMLAGMKEFAGQNLIENKLRGSTASGANQINQMGGGASGMGAIVDLYGKEQDKLADLTIQGEQNWANNQVGLQNQLGIMANLQDRKNDWERKKYLSNMAESSDMKGGAIHNLYESSKDVADSIIINEEAKANKKNYDYFVKMMGELLASGNNNKGSNESILVGSQDDGNLMLQGHGPNYGIPQGNLLEVNNQNSNIDPNKYINLGKMIYNLLHN